MRAPTKTLITLLAALGCATGVLKAQISVGPTGVGPIDFSTTPLPPSEWATLDITTGNAGTYSNPAAVDAGAQTLDQSTITTPLGIATANGTARLARQNTTAGYLVTQPTGVPAAVLKATLRNTSGATLTDITVSYNFIVAVAGVTDEAPGHRVFYSTTGLPDSWQLLPSLSGLTASAAVSAGITLNWLDNTDIYLLWLDDNNQTGADGAFAIDNFAVVPGLPPCPAIATQPQNVSIVQCTASSVAFSVGATGAVTSIQWFRSNDMSGFQAIVGANSSTFTVTNVGLSDSGSSFRAEITGPGTCASVTSSSASLTVIADLTPPRLVFSYVATNLTNIVLSFSESVDTNNPDFFGNQILVDTNTGTQVSIAGQTFLNSTTIELFVSETAPLDPAHGYAITLSGVTDTCAANTLPDTQFPIGRLVEHVIAFDSTWKYNINNGDLSATGWQNPGFDDSAWPSGQAGLGHESDAGSIGEGSIGFPGLNAVPIRTHLNYASNGVVAYFRQHFTLPAASTNNAGLILHDVIEDGAVYYLNGQEIWRTRMPAGPLTFTTLANGAAEPQQVSGPFNIPARGLVVGDNVLAVAVHQSSATSSDMQMAADLSVVVGQPTTPTAGPRLSIARNNGSVTITWSGGGTLQRSTDLNNPSNWQTITGASSGFQTNTAAASQMFFRVTVP